jgi:uncharacterized cupredoxin-like copper-binding protein
MKRTTFLLGLITAIAGIAAFAVPALATTTAQTVRVTETNYRIAFSAKPKAGTVRFVIRNAADDTHDLVLRGGGKTYRSRTLGPGAGATLVAKLRKGVRYTFWCSISDHAEEGMRGSFIAR